MLVDFNWQAAVTKLITERVRFCGLIKPVYNRRQGMDGIMSYITFLGLPGVFVNIRVLVLFSMILLSGCATLPSADKSMIEALSGYWDEASNASCSANYHTITFSDAVLKIKFVEKGYISEGDDGRQIMKYNILSENEEFLRVELVGETRLDDNGRPVVWHIKPLSADQYCWGRDDWAENACTVPRYRCKPDMYSPKLSKEDKKIKKKILREFKKDDEFRNYVDVIFVKSCDELHKFIAPRGIEMVSATASKTVIKLPSGRTIDLTSLYYNCVN